MKRGSIFVAVMGVLALLAACAVNMGSAINRHVALHGNDIGDYLDKQYGIWIAGYEFPGWVALDLPESASAAEALALTRQALKGTPKAEFRDSSWLDPQGGWIEVIGATGESAQDAIKTIYEYKLEELPGTGGKIFALSPAVIAPTSTEVSAKFPALAHATVGAMRDVTITSILQKLAEQCGFVILTHPINPRLPSNRVDLPTDMPAGECIEWLNKELAGMGFALLMSSTDRPILAVVDLYEGKKKLVPCRYGSDLLKIPLTDDIVTQIIPLHYHNAQETTNLARVLGSMSGHDISVRHNFIYLTASSEFEYRLVEIILSMERQAQAAAAARQLITQSVTLNHARAEDVAKAINIQFGPSPPPPPTTGRGGGSGPARPVWPPTRVTADARTNTLIINGPVGRMAEVLEAIRKTDQEAGR